MSRGSAQLRAPARRRGPAQLSDSARLESSGGDADGSAGKALSVVVPAYNEQDNVRLVYERLCEVMGQLDIEWELIFSVDPCTDRTEELIRALCTRDRRVKMLRFSRHFGQPMATLAGMEAASGDAVVVIDCDLQDPPELIPELLACWREGYDCRVRPAPNPGGRDLAQADRRSPRYGWDDASKPAAETR